MIQRAEYDGAADKLYVYLLDGAVERSEALDDRRSVDYDVDGRVVGVAVAHPFAGGINLSGVPSSALVGELILGSGLKFRLVE